MVSRSCAAVFAVAVLWAGVAQAQICRVTPFNTTNSKPTAVTSMTVSADYACSIASNRNDVVVTVTRQPRNGTVTVNGGIAIYRPRPGFTGRDSFVTQRELMQASPSAVLRTLTVNVEVVAQQAAGPAPGISSMPDAGPRFVAPAQPPVAAVPRVAVPCVPNAVLGGIASTTVAVPMRVMSGSFCTIRIQGSGITPRLDSRPRFGIVTIDGTLVTYRPMPGYRGRDAFSFSWSLPVGNGERFIAGINVTVE